MTKVADAKPTPIKKQSRRALIVGSALFVIVLLSGADGFLAYAYQYRDKVYRGVTVGEKDVSGLTKPELDSLVREYTSSVEREGIQIQSPKKTYRLLTSATSADSSLAHDYIHFAADDSATEAFALGKTGRLFDKLRTQLTLLFSPQAIPFSVDYEELLVDIALKDFFSDEELPAQNANIRFKDNDDPEIVAEQPGQIFVWQSVHQMMQKRLLSLSREPVQISLAEDKPTVTTKDAESQKDDALSLLSRLPIALKHQNDSWKITKETLRKGLVLERTHDGKIQFALSQESLNDLFSNASQAIEVAPLDAKFKIENGRVVEFQGSRVGLAIDREQTKQDIVHALNGEKVQEVVIATKQQLPLYETDDVNYLGITELVATGKTNFAGSPVNRRHNIKIGAEKLNGLLIKPGETFTTITAVGPVDGKNGYKQELVIKGNRTIPEYGGGLCQIGTTLFRLVLNAGLPVVERRNHSYRVSYYEPPVGMDATIYEMKPDFRFTNDYATPLLLQARIEGDDLIFEFYGTKDDRVAESSTPRVFNVVRPGPKKIVETDTLPPGQTKCIEKAHNGSDAEFTYTVTYPSGEVKKEVFKSHYKPWQEVCLVGKAAAPKTEAQ